MSVDEKAPLELYHPIDLFLLEQEYPEGDMPKCRPIKIRIMQNMYGPIFAVRCRACDGTFGYMADLPHAFESAERHIQRHLYQLEVVEKEVAITA